MDFCLRRLLCCLEWGRPTAILPELGAIGLRKAPDGQEGCKMLRVVAWAQHKESWLSPLLCDFEQVICLL